MADNKIKLISRSAILIALLLVLQFITKALGQIVTGSCVNAVLAVSVLYSGLWSGIIVALVSPIFAFLLGIAPQFFPLTPAIAAGNCVLVLILHIICKDNCTLSRAVLGCVCAAVLKFITLYLLVVKLICSVAQLADKQIAMFSATFTWPQLITALIGTGLALIIVGRLKKLNTK